MAFNIFEPVDLPVLITDTFQTIAPREKNAQPEDKTFYNICSRWVARDGSGLTGRVEVAGSCWEHPSKPDRLVVCMNVCVYTAVTVPDQAF